MDGRTASDTCQFKLSVLSPTHSDRSRNPLQDRNHAAHCTALTRPLQCASRADLQLHRVRRRYRTVPASPGADQPPHGRCLTRRPHRRPRVASLAPGPPGLHVTRRAGRFPTSGSAPVWHRYAATASSRPACECLRCRSECAGMIRWRECPAWRGPKSAWNGCCRRCDSAFLPSLPGQRVKRPAARACSPIGVSRFRALEGVSFVFTRLGSLKARPDGSRTVSVRCAVRVAAR